MDMEGALRARLLAAAPVTSVAGTRIYWMSRPQGALLPAIVLQGGRSAEREQHLKGLNDLQFARVQVDSLALSFAAALALKNAAIAALIEENTSNGIQFNHATIEDISPFVERTETAEIHALRFDALFYFQPTPL